MGCLPVRITRTRPDALLRYAKSPDSDREAKRVGPDVSRRRNPPPLQVATQASNRNAAASSSASRLLSPVMCQQASCELQREEAREVCISSCAKKKKYPHTH